MIPEKPSVVTRNRAALKPATMGFRFLHFINFAIDVVGRATIGSCRSQRVRSRMLMPIPPAAFIVRSVLRTVAGA